MQGRFTDRHRYRGTEQEIAVRENVPQWLSFAIPLIARDVDMSPGNMRRDDESKTEPGGHFEFE